MAIVDQKPPPAWPPAGAPGGPPEARVYAITPKSADLLKAIGVWPLASPPPAIRCPTNPTARPLRSSLPRRPTGTPRGCAVLP